MLSKIIQTSKMNSIYRIFWTVSNAVAMQRNPYTKGISLAEEEFNYV
jgi:hypothetical protein